MSDTDPRPGETFLPVDPTDWDDARLVFIGRVRSPWRERHECPKNVRLARASNAGPARVEIDPPFHAALASLRAPHSIFLLSWLHRARRDLAEQRPRHAEESISTFALRSPVRPNPIGLHLVELVSVDAAAGLLTIDAIDLLDGTPILDIKPYHPGVDRPPGLDG